MILADFEEERIWRRGQELVVLVARLRGTVPGGSLGNSAVLGIANRLQERVTGTGELGLLAVAGVLLDCLELEYRYGDAFGVLWLSLMQRGIPVVLIADGATRQSLETLRQGSVPVPLARTEKEGRELLGTLISAD